MISHLKRITFNWWASSTTFFIVALLGGFIAGPVLSVVLAMIIMVIVSYFDPGVRAFRLNEEGVRLQHFFSSSTEALSGYILLGLDVPVKQYEELTHSITKKIASRTSTFWFEAGSHDHYALSIAVRNFEKYCHHHSSLVRTLCNVLIDTVELGQRHCEDAQQIAGITFRLDQIKQALDLPSAFFEEIERLKPVNETVLPLNTTRAAKILEVAANASRKEIKIAYKRKVQDIHPDRLIAQGAKDELLRQASDEMNRLRKAYEFMLNRH